MTPLMLPAPRPAGLLPALATPAGAHLPSGPVLCLPASPDEASPGIAWSNRKFQELPSAARYALRLACERMLDQAAEFLTGATMLPNTWAEHAMRFEAEVRRIGREHMDHRRRQFERPRRQPKEQAATAAPLAATAPATVASPYSPRRVQPSGENAAGAALRDLLAELADIHVEAPAGNRIVRGPLEYMAATAIDQTGSATALRITVYMPPGSVGVKRLQAVFKAGEAQACQDWIAQAMRQYEACQIDWSRDRLPAQARRAAL